MPRRRKLLADKLGNMISMMSKSIGEYSSLERLSLESQKFGNRRRAIQWMKEVAAGFRISPDARDSGVQIFDKFLALILFDNDERSMLPIAINNTQDTSLQNFANIYLGKNHLGMELGDELDPNVVSYAAAVSIILGSKLHESNGELTLGTFQDFDIEALKYFERLVLEKLYFAISPQVTPYAFIRKLLLIWEPENENTELVKIADTLVSDFWEEPTSMLFAPSTIAIAALILSFSILRTDCTSWLSSIPNFCLPLSDNPLSQSNSNSPCMGVGVGVTHHSYYCDRNGFATNSSPTSSPFTSRQNRNFRLFDIDKCLMSFKPVEAKYSRRNSSGKNIHNVSPTSVIDLSPSELMTPTKENVQIVHDLNGRNELNDRIYETHGLENATNGNSMITVNLDKVDKNSNTNNSKYDIQDTIEKIKLKNKRSFSLNNLVPDHEKSCRVSVCLAGDLDFFVNTENKETNNDINRDDIDFQLNKRVRCENLNKIKEKDLRNRKIKINILDISVNNKIKENCGKKHRAAFSPISFSTSKTISM